MPPSTTAHTRHRMTLLGLASSLTGLDFTIIYVALPDIQRAVVLSDAQAAWIVTAYVLAFGGFLLLFGRASDLVGQRRVFILGMWFFAIGSMAGTLATGAEILIAARAVQGLGAAALFPSTLALVTSTFPPGPVRQRALTVWATSGAAGLTLGALLGGALTALTWRGVFLINVPLAALAIIGAFRVVPAERGTVRNGRLDVVGAVTGTLAVALVVLTFTRAAEAGGWGASGTASALGAVLLGAAFVIVQRRGRDPLVPRGLLASGTLRAMLAVITIFGISLQSLPYVLTLHFRHTLGLSAILAGLGFLLPTVAIAAGNLIGERSMLRSGQRRVLIAGLLLAVAGNGYLAVAATGTSYLRLSPGLILSGLGMGLVFPAMFAAASEGARLEHRGAAAAVASTALQVGAAIGVALITWVLHLELGSVPRGFAVIGGIAVLAVIPAVTAPDRLPHPEPSEA